MNIISIKDFYKLKDIDKKTLIEDIFYCKQEHDNKPNSKGINTNFCVHATQQFAHLRHRRTSYNRLYK